MITRFVCQDCHQEVEGEVYHSSDYVGCYAECPECGAENEVKEVEGLPPIEDTFLEGETEEEVIGDLPN